MKISVVETEAGLDALQEPWDRLSRETSASIFSSHEYVRTAWKHFREPADRLFILVLSEGDSITGIAPFFVSWHRRLAIPYRVIRFVAVWEGDRPGILTREGRERECWLEIQRFLTREARSWEVLDLSEQPVEGPEGAGWRFLAQPGWYWEETPDAVGYYISLNGSWDEYVAQRPGKERREWRRQVRRLSSLSGGFHVERVSEPDRIREALSRFQAIERAGWKAEAGIGVAKDERHRAFYDDLTARLAGRQQVVAHFLKNKATDLAGLISFTQGRVVYVRHTAYSPAYAAFSPGIILHAEVFREFFSMPFQELDLLGLREDESSARHKTDWATGRRETVQLTGYRLRSRILPIVVAKRLKRLFRRGSRRGPGTSAGA